MQVEIEASWKNVLASEFEKPYFLKMAAFLKSQKESGITIYPPGSRIFAAFEDSPFQKTKVVILGQDPYHNPGEAMGLSFSVPKGIRVPPSLKNIYKEMHTDVSFQDPGHGDLTAWAQQGVLMLNAMLTVEHKKAGSHRNIGWQEFTNAVIQRLSSQREHIVFMLWGNFAKSKAELIDGSRHLILKAAHPSPLARGAYFGSRHFSKANAYLASHGIQPIDWTL